MLYPLKFQSILKDKIWGGTKLEKVLGKETHGSNTVGESWEISGVEGSVSVVSEGVLAENDLQELIEVYMSELVGEKVYEKFGLDFPLLVKFIDANADLSIQVHPNDEVAKERHGTYGKSEMWISMEGGDGRSLVSGFKTDANEQDLMGRIENGTLSEILNVVNVENGDVFDLPAGRIHTIGSGNLILEIQQSSDVTYRLYDYDRKDADGNKRELHVDLAKDVIDYQKTQNATVQYDRESKGLKELVKNEHFVVNMIKNSDLLPRDYYGLDSFVIVVGIEGRFVIDGDDFDAIVVTKGESVLIPASIHDIIYQSLGGDSQFVEVYVP